MSIDSQQQNTVAGIPWPLDMGFTNYKEQLITDKAELILVREPLKLEDILLSVYDYEFITDQKRKYKNTKTDD